MTAVYETEQSKSYMGEDKAHVPAMELWSYTSGTANLSDDNFEHLLLCHDCQALLDEFISVLDHLPSMNPNQAA